MCPKKVRDDKLEGCGVQVASFTLKDIKDAISRQNESSFGEL